MACERYCGGITHELSSISCRNPRAGSGLPEPPRSQVRSGGIASRLPADINIPYTLLPLLCGHPREAERELPDGGGKGRTGRVRFLSQSVVSPEETC